MMSLTLNLMVLRVKLTRPKFFRMSGPAREVQLITEVRMWSIALWALSAQTFVLLAATFAAALGKMMSMNRTGALLVVLAMCLWIWASRVGRMAGRNRIVTRKVSGPHATPW